MRQVLSKALARNVLLASVVASVSIASIQMGCSVDGARSKGTARKAAGLSASPLLVLKGIRASGYQPGPRGRFVPPRSGLPRVIWT